MHINGYEIKPRADLCWADLSGANLIGANLHRANLSGADLSGADLCRANLLGADLSRANLYRTNLTGANLTEANLTGADLTRADLCWANLSGANLSGVDLPHFQICPEVGEFVAYKKLRNNVVATLKIPATAARTSSLVGRKCRAEFAQVLDLGAGIVCGFSKHNNLPYELGKTVFPDLYDSDIRVECTNGIHFFMTRREAEEY